MSSTDESAREPWYILYREGREKHVFPVGAQLTEEQMADALACIRRVARDNGWSEYAADQIDAVCECSLDDRVETLRVPADVDVTFI